MRFGFSARAWEPKDELSVFRAVKTLEIEAHTWDEAHFLVRLHACFYRGVPDEHLVQVVNAINEAAPELPLP